MITERELLEAIRKCERDPVTYNSCEKLANYYIIYDHLFGEPRDTVSREIEKVISVDGDTEFLQIVNGMNSEKVWSVMDELLTTIQVINPRLYDGVIRKLTD